jgi:hypothetical protein
VGTAHPLCAVVTETLQIPRHVMQSECSGSCQECQIGATINVIINTIAHATCVDVTVDF